MSGSEVMMGDDDGDQHQEATEMSSNVLRQGEVCEIVNEESDGRPVADDMEDGNEENNDVQILEDDSVQGFFQHSAPVYVVATHPTDVDRVCTGGGDDKAFQWSISSGDEQCQQLDPAHSDSVIAVRYSSDGTLLCTAGMDGVVRVFDISGTPLHTLDGPSSEIEWIHWHPRGPALAVGSADGTVWLWHVTQKSAAVIHIMSQDVGPVTCGTFAGESGKVLCTGAEDGSVRVWSCKTGQIVSMIKSGPMFHEAPICCKRPVTPSSVSAQF